MADEDIALLTIQMMMLQMDMSEELVDTITKTYPSLEALAEAQEADLKDFIKTLARNGMHMPIPVIVNPNCPTEMLALQHYARQRIAFGLSLDVDDMEEWNQTLVNRHTRFRNEEARLKGLKTAETTLPAIKSTTNWSNWSDLLKDKLSNITGSNDCSLLYIIRDHDDPTPEMQDYGRIHANLTNYEAFLKDAMAFNTGTRWNSDNNEVFIILKSAVSGSGANSASNDLYWTSIKSLEARGDGRGAFKILKGLFEGPAASGKRYDAATAILNTTRYTGDKKNFTLEAYFGVLQAQFVEFEAINEKKTERAKLAYLNSTMLDPTLQTAKDIIFAPGSNITTFEKAREHLFTLNANHKTAQAMRQKELQRIAALERTKTPKKGKAGGDKFRSKGGKATVFGGKTASGILLKAPHNYTSEELRTFTPEEREKLTKLRADAKKKRNVSSTTKTTPEVESDSDEEATAAGDQFGPAAHGKGKRKGKGKRN